MVSEPTTSGTILVHREGKVAIIQVNRPERKNAMTAEMSREFVGRLKELGQAHDVRAVVITGTEDVFLSGADVGKVTSKLSDMTPIEWREFRDLLHEQLWSLYTMPKPTIAAINGSAVVGGVEVALACDIRIASEDSRFRVGFRRMALMPSPAICFLLPFVVGPGWAKLLAFSDRFINAQEAQRIGLVEEVVPRDQLMPEALRLATELADGPSLMIAATKQAMNQAFGLNFDVLRRQIDSAQFVLTRSEDHREALAAFLEKR
ncbi:MAG: enoyl-CoA hydratase/isomerase family protein, partial [Anaerolineae bacterium]